MKDIGIDIGKRRCVACLMSQNETALEETKYKNACAAADACRANAMHSAHACFHFISEKSAP